MLADDPGFGIFHRVRMVESGRLVIPGLGDRDQNKPVLDLFGFAIRYAAHSLGKKLHDIDMGWAGPAVDRANESFLQKVYGGDRAAR